MQIIQAPRASSILYNLLIKREDRRPWLLPANICPIVPITFFKAQIPIEFVDISDATLQMDLEQTKARLEQGDYGGVLYAHTYGESSSPNAFFKELKGSHPDMLLIDDRCLCVPELEPEPAAKADVTLYSTGYAKIVELNFGGYAFVRDSLPYERVHLRFNPEDYLKIEKSYKQAIQTRQKIAYQDSDWLETEAVLPSWYDYRQQIQRRLHSSMKQREAIRAVYEPSLPSEIQMPEKYQTWRFNIRVKNKSQVLDAIFERGLFASSHYASLAGIMTDGYAPMAEKLASEVINLFIDHHFTPQMAEKASTIIRETLIDHP